MATVRGMTPEAIRALLKKEIGDYQALSIAVSNAKGTSESAIREVETIREDLKNMDFDFDTSQFDKAMEELKQDMSDLTESLDKVAEESLARETKLTALELALNQDREKFNQEMLDMAKELEASKESLKKELTEATEKLANNLTEVGTNLSGELEKANKTLSDSLAKDLSKLNTDLKAAFGKDLKNLETRQNSKTDALDKNLKDYKSNTDSKMGTLLSEIDKAKAYADGFLQPGNLVWNPMALDNARYIVPLNGNATVEAETKNGYNGHGLKITKTETNSVYIRYGDETRATFNLTKGSIFYVSAWVRSNVNIPKKSFALLVTKSIAYYNPTDIPANTWVQLEGEVPYNNDFNDVGVFNAFLANAFPQNATITVSNPYAKAKVTSDLIVDGAVQSQSLATGAVTAGKIAADAVTANNIAAGSIGADKIVANAIGADQLAANAVTADKIAANAVDADKIKAKSIGSDQLAANAVTAEKLAAKAVKAGNIDSNAVTAQHLAANAVTADKIAANSVDTTKLTVMPGNLFPDPRFLDPIWGPNTNRKAGKFFGYENGYQIRAIGKQTGAYYWPSGIPRDTAMRLEPGAAYRLTCRINFEGENPPDRLDVYLRFLNKKTGKKSAALAGGIARTEGNTNIENAYGVGSMDFVYPDYAQDDLCTMGLFLQREHDSGSVTVTDVTIVRAADASLIVKGGIQSDHIAANAITSDHISVGSIDGDRIAANSLDADKIKANSLTSDHVKFKDGFIKNAMIDDGQITNAKIKDLNASKITSGTIDADRIGSNTIESKHIKSGSLTSDNVTIKDGAIKTAMIGNGQITDAQIKNLNAGKITAGTLNANRIGSKSITGAKLAANTITGDHIKANSIRVGELHADAIIQSGMSLILSEATGPRGELEPIWWKIPGVVKFSDPEVDGEAWYGSPGDRIEASPPSSVKIKILQGIKYRLKFNIVASRGGSRLFIEMRDQNGNRAVKSGAVYQGAASYKQYKGPSSYIKQAHDYTNSTEGNYLVANYLVPATPTQVVALIEFNPDVTHVYLSRFYFNHSNGGIADVRISGLTLEADVPNQEEIDKRQDSELAYLKKFTQNVANLIVRYEYYIGEQMIFEHGFEGVPLHYGVGVKFPKSKDTIHFYLRAGWQGRIDLEVFYTDGNVDTFTLRTNDFRNYDIKPEKESMELPPRSFEDPTTFAYASVSTNKFKIPKYARAVVRNAMSNTEVMRLISQGSVPINNSYDLKRRYSTDSTPPWDKGWSSSRRPW